MSVPYTFATAATTIPLSELDANFATAITLGSVAMILGNTYTNISGLTLTSPTISGATLTAPILGTPASGNLVNCTFPTLNQSTTGNAATATAPAGGGSFITSVNIGAQSVSFASTAGNGGVTSVNGNTGAVTIPTLNGTLGQLFTSSGTFTIPTGVTALKVTVIGGGGGGAGNNYSGCCAQFVGGNAGGTSSFGAYVTASGGGGATISGFPAGGTAGGTALSLAITGGTPFPINTSGSYAGLGGGGTFLALQGNNNTSRSGYGRGGAISAGQYAQPWQGHGSGGGTGIGYITGLTPGGTVTVTIGAGGTVNAVVGGGSQIGYAGQAGVVIVEW